MSSDWKKRVIQSFGVNSGSYAQNNFVQKRIAEGLARNLPKYVSPRVLEVGCGTGDFTRHLLSAYQGGRFDITDLSEEMLRDAQASISDERVTWHVMDGEAPDVDGNYDLIVGNMAFQWFERPHEALSRLRDLLSDDGTLLYSVPSAKSFPEWRSSLDALGLPHGLLKPVDWGGGFEEQDIIVDYGNTFGFLRSLKQTGAHIPNAEYQAMSVPDLRRACKVNDRNYGGQATWKILYGKIKYAGASE